MRRWKRLLEEVVTAADSGAAGESWPQQLSRLIFHLNDGERSTDTFADVGLMLRTLSTRELPQLTTIISTGNGKLEHQSIAWYLFGITDVLQRRDEL